MFWTIHDYIKENQMSWQSLYETNEPFRPFKVKFKLTNRCNLKCRKCNYWKRELIELKQEKVINVIDQLIELDTMSLKLTGGEVTMLSYLPSIMKYIRQNSEMTIRITTNGTLID